MFAREPGAADRTTRSRDGARDALYSGRMGPRRLEVLAAAALLLLAAPARGQSIKEEYDRRYGPVVEVSLSDLMDNANAYQGRAVRTRGRLDIPDSSTGGR